MYWSCLGRADILRVQNLSFGGIFIETREPQSAGTKAQIDFLVEEGLIRTRAVEYGLNYRNPYPKGMLVPSFNMIMKM